MFIDEHAPIEKANTGRQEPEGEFSFALLPTLPSPFLLVSSEPASEEVARSHVKAARVSSLIMGHEEIFKISDVARLN